MQQTSMITAGDPAANDYFGSSCARSGNGLVMAVGAYLWEGGTTNQGGVYIYDWVGSQWFFREVLTASDPASNRYGISCSLSYDGNVLAVGANFWDDTFSDQGVVYIYNYNGSSYVEQVKLTASDANTNDRFGSSCSLSYDGKTLAIGSMFWEGSFTNQGAVYIFYGDGSTYTEDEIINASDPAANDYFGASCSLSGNGQLLAIGSYLWEGPTSNQGAVYILKKQAGSWDEQQQVVASDPTSGDRFGVSCSLSGDGSVLASGATHRDDGGTDRGSVYIFDINGADYIQRLVLNADDASDSDYFGSACHLSDDGNSLAVGAYFWDGTFTNQGAVYLYKSDLADLPKIGLCPVGLRSVLMPSVLIEGN